MTIFEDSRAKLTNTGINNLKSAAKKMTVAILRITRKIFQDEELPHELLLTTIQKT